jgi:hypothetical protein
MRITEDAMQTFLPYPDFRATALALDRRRLGKQRVEALQVLRGLVVPGYGWRRHPAVKMWLGYEEALVRYGLEVCRVWREQGHQDTCAATLVATSRRPGPTPRSAASTSWPPRVNSRPGSATTPSTRATARPWSVRTPRPTRPSSRGSPMTCRTSGRRRTARSDRHGAEPGTPRRPCGAPDARSRPATPVRPREGRFRPPRSRGPGRGWSPEAATPRRRGSAAPPRRRTAKSVR